MTVLLLQSSLGLASCASSVTAAACLPFSFFCLRVFYSNQAAQALPVAAAANAEYLRAKELHADDDFCAVIEALRSKP